MEGEDHRDAGELSMVQLSMSHRVYLQASISLKIENRHLVLPHPIVFPCNHDLFPILNFWAVRALDDGDAAVTRVVRT